MAIMKANIWIMCNNGTKEDKGKMKSLSYYNILKLSLPLVQSNICDVNKKEKTNVIIQR